MNLESKRFAILLFIFFVTNLVFASITELSFDESYYWFFSKHLAWGYYDHPPAIAFFIKLGTTLFGESELGVRFFSSVLSSASVYLCWLTLNKKHGLRILVLFMSMPLLHFSGLLAIPDTPLLFFTTAFFYMLKRYLEKDTIQNSIFLALAITGMFYSKYHGILVIILTVASNPGFFKKKSFWGVAFLTTLLYLPHMHWQYVHDFVSFKFHLTGRREKHFELLNILDYIGGQFVLAGMFVSFIVYKLLYKYSAKSVFERVLKFNSIGFLVFLFFMSFRNQIEANWTVTCAVAILLFVTGKVENVKNFYYLGLVSISVLLGGKALLSSPGFFIKDLSKKESRLNEVYGWRNGRIDEVQRICDGRRIVADVYQMAAKFSFYLKQEIPAIHLGSRESHYTLLGLDKNFSQDEKICYFTSKRLKGAVKIETGYKDPIYILKSISLNKLYETYGSLR